VNPHQLICQVEHTHWTEDEARACEAEHRALMQRLTEYAA